MKLARYSVDGRTTIGVVQADEVFDIDRLDPTAPRTIRDLLALGVAGRRRIEDALRARPAGRPCTPAPRATPPAQPTRPAPTTTMFIDDPYASTGTGHKTPPR